MALKRPVWGVESSSQVMRHIDPEAKYFACFDATSGFHQIKVDEESSKLMNIVTQIWYLPVHGPRAGNMFKSGPLQLDH